MEWMGLMICCGMAVKGIRMLRVNVRGTDCKDGNSDTD